MSLLDLPQCEVWPEWTALERDGHEVHAAMRDQSGHVYAVFGAPKAIAHFVQGKEGYTVHPGDAGLLPAWAEMLATTLRGNH
jgi:hypothetical protein